MNELKWISEKEQEEELNKRIAKWKQGNSKDGFVLAAEGIFEYRGVKYILKVLRYYNHTNKFCAMSTRISDRHVTVEYPDETREFVELAEKIDEYMDCLYHDTLHLYNDNQTVEEQINEMHKTAKKDIDRVLDEGEKMINNQIDKLNKIKERIIEINKANN